MDYIETFEVICSTTSWNGVPAAFLKCKLFSWSLTDRALRWLKSLAPGSLTSWEATRSAFLDKFYTKSKTASLRVKITQFQQNVGEPFNETWERFIENLRECPHHGYSDEQVLNIFYDGVDWDFRNSLNAASNGDFMKRTKEEAYTLIENLAASSSHHNPEYDRTRCVNSIESKKIDELSAKLNNLTALRKVSPKASTTVKAMRMASSIRKLLMANHKIKKRYITCKIRDL